jgi:hypothetical protein
LQRNLAQSIAATTSLGRGRVAVYRGYFCEQRASRVVTTPGPFSLPTCPFLRDVVSTHGRA